MIKWVHHTIEDVIKKVMTSQQLWYEMLDSVLFAICVTRHTSISTSPFRLVYNKDPILPFEYADRNDNLVHESTECNVSQPINEDRNPLFELIEKMETQCKNLFDRAKNKIQKSQEHQA